MSVSRIDTNLNSKNTSHVETHNKHNKVDKVTSTATKALDVGAVLANKTRTPTDSLRFFNDGVHSTGADGEEHEQKLKERIALTSPVSPPKTPRRRLRSHSKSESEILQQLEAYTSQHPEMTPKEIVNHFGKEKKTKKSWIEHIERVRVLEEACERVETKIEELEFDKYPIGGTPYYDVRDNFRAFFCSELDLKTSFFRINEIPYALPETISDAEDSERPEIFMAWLIGILEKEFPKQSTLSPEDQAHIMCRGVPSQDELDALKGMLTDLLPTLKEQDFKTVKEMLEILGVSKNFQEWAEDHLADYIYFDGNIDDILSKYESDVNFKVLKRDVPCFRLLQSLSFRAFSYAEKCLHSTYCPAFFKNGQNEPQLKRFPLDPTFFLIKIDEKGQYAATQAKLYRFFTTNGSPENLIFGKTAVHCTLNGNLASEKRTGFMRMRNLELNNTANLELREHVVKDLELI